MKRDLKEYSHDGTIKGLSSGKDKSMRDAHVAVKNGFAEGKFLTDLPLFAELLSLQRTLNELEKSLKVGSLDWDFEKFGVYGS